MSSRAVADHFAKVFSAFDTRDTSTLATFISEDVQLRLGNASLIRGKAGFVDAVDAFHDSVAGVHHEILDVYTDEDLAIVELDVHYTRHDRRTVVLPCCNVFRIRDGLISEYRSYMDATPLHATPDVGASNEVLAIKEQPR